MSSIAHRSIFQQAAGTIAGKLGGVREESGIVGFFVPFYRTLASIAAEGLTMTPGVVGVRRVRSGMWRSEMLARPEYAGLSDTQKAATLRAALATAAAMADLELGDSVERSPKDRARLAYEAIPHYEGISSKGTPEEIRRGNYETQKAHARLNELAAQYRAKGSSARIAGFEAQDALAKENREVYKLAMRPAIDKAYLDLKKARIYKELGVDPNPPSKALPGVALPVRTPAAVGTGR